MQNAIIYTRVSTDEQAQKGYSLRYQEDILRQYCTINRINILAHFQDDYSAKTIDRPAFIELREYIQANKGRVDLLLIVKWDRFSRNTSDSYQLIRQFQKMGVKVQAIEQPIDPSVPEQKLMLAVYLSFPEIENDRRALNTKSGMVKAMKEGRWVARAPIGYMMSRDAGNKPHLILSEQANLVREIFEKFATGLHTQQDLKRKAREQGLKISTSHLNRILTNPVYAGKVKIPKWHEEGGKLIDGLHEPIIDIQLFARVQEIISTSSKRGKKSKRVNDALPLRGHLLCPKCYKNLTGSQSKGNGGKYYYYHCQKGCKTRYKADSANEVFESYLSDIKIKPEVAELYSEILKEVYSQEDETRLTKIAQLESEITEAKNRLLKIDERFVDEEIDKESHRRLIDSTANRLQELIHEKAALENSDQNYNEYLSDGFKLLQELDSFYRKSSIEMKHDLIGSIFPDKLVYENGKYRTNSNENIISLISLNNEILEYKEGEENSYKEKLSQMVALTGIEPVFQP